MIDLSRYLDARAFLIGLAVSFAGLSAAGWLVSSRNMFIDYQRSHQFISVESQFMPSARHLRALVEDTMSPDKIAVIIGGSSVFRGAGQSADGLWSRELQGALGDRYQVFNMALNGGSPGGQALYFSEVLKRQGYKVIFLADLSLSATIYPDNGVYRGLYFDAYYRGYLDFPSRMKFIEGDLFGVDPQALTELQIGSATNAYLNFNDLWTYFGYNAGFTIWTPLLREDPFIARSNFKDNEANCTLGAGYEINFHEEMKIVQDYAQFEVDQADLKLVTESTFAEEFEQNVALVLPPFSPFYVDKLSSEVREQYSSSFVRLRSQLDSVGIQAFVVPQIFGEEDFCDRVHFAPSGGAKMAIYLAPLIVAKARELGYE